MYIESDTSNVYQDIPSLNQRPYEMPVLSIDTSYTWNLPEDTTVSASDSVHFCPSIFTEHLMPADQNFAKIHRDNFTNFVTGISLFILFVMAVAYMFQSRKTTLVMQSLFSKRMASQLLRESRIFNERIYLYMMTIVFSVQSLFLVILQHRFASDLGAEFSFMALFVFGIVAVMADHYVKYLFSQGFASLFDYQPLINVFKTNKFFYLTFISIILFPLLLVAFYTGKNWPLGLYASLFCICYIFMIYNTISLNLGKVNWLLFFLYFCTIEILPYAVMLKFVQTLVAA